MARTIVGKPYRIGRPDARIASEDHGRLALAIPRRALATRRRPHGGGIHADRRLGSAYDLTHAARTLAQRGRHAVDARVTTAYDDDVLICRIDARRPFVEQRPRGFAQVVERELDARKVGSRHVHTSRRARTAGEHDRGRLAANPLGASSSVNAARKFDTTSLHEFDATLDHPFRKLHVGNAVHEKTAGTFVSLVHAHARTEPRELPCGGKPCRARSHNADERRISCRRWQRVDPTRPCDI